MKKKLLLAFATFMSIFGFGTAVYATPSCHGGYSTYYETAFVYCDAGTPGVASYRVAVLCDDSQSTGRWWFWDVTWNYIGTSSRADCHDLAAMGYGEGYLNAVGWTYVTRSY